MRKSLEGRFKIINRQNYHTQSDSAYGQGQLPESQDYFEDIRNLRVRELLRRYHQSQRQVSKKESTGQKASRSQLLHLQKNYLQQALQRQWLVKKGKKYLIDFDDDERKQIKKYFSSLADKKTGTISTEQLQELLLSVGLFETREQAKELIDEVDQERTGMIEFDKFLAMMKNDKKHNEGIVSFFKSIMVGDVASMAKRKFRNKTIVLQSSELEETKMPPGTKCISFETVVNNIRRQHMLTALNIGPRVRDGCGRREPTNEEIIKGKRIMNALQEIFDRKLIRQARANRRGIKLPR